MPITVRVVDPDLQPVPGAKVVALSANGTTLDGTTDDEGCFTYTEPFPDKSRTIFVADPRRPGGVAHRSSSDLSTTSVVAVGAEGSTGSLIDGGWVEVPALGSMNPKRDEHDRLYVYGKNLSFNDSPARPFHCEINKPFEAVNAQGDRMELCVKAALSNTFLIDYTPL
jgi:hypothetical protein